MKISTSDSLAILRGFEIASEESVPRQIERLSVTQPTATNTLAQFRYNMQQFAILIDGDAGDDVEYLQSKLDAALPGVEHNLLPNPRDSRHNYGYPYKGKDIYLFQLGAITERLDAYLARTYSDISRSSWQKHIRQGAVTVDGQPVTSPKTAILADSDIAINLPEAPNHDDSELPIVYLDDDIIVIDKPAGVLTHHKNQLDTEFTVADMVARYAREPIEGERPGIVHRLDRDTSGIIVGARTQAAYDALKSQFADRTASKQYVALIKGHLAAPKLKIDIPIARNSAKPGTFRGDKSGKDAQTLVEVIDQSDEFSLLRLTPRTGRTHQLRVHMAHLGKPIYGDKLYGAKAADRLYLHAHRLTLTLLSGERKQFESPLPANFSVSSHEAGQ